MACYNAAGQSLGYVSFDGQHILQLADLEAGTYHCRAYPGSGRYGCYTLEGFPGSDDPGGAAASSVTVQQLLLREKQ